MIFFILMVLKALVMFIMVALGVGFFTLLERKVLSYIQLRKGPNKVGYLGLPQPLADAAKLFSKENINLSFSMKSFYLGAPVAALFIVFMLWSLYPSVSGLVSFKLGFLFFLTVSSLNVYTIMVSGWSSNSKYSLLGALRSIAQTISYEVSMSLVVSCVLILCLSFDFMKMGACVFWLIWVMPPIFVMWMVSCLAETNRSPFDLAEGESELVSGFNIEYGGGEFAFLFIAEYGSILLMSLLTVVMFFSGVFGFLNGIKVLMISYIFLWVRGSYPRMRYDTLMSLTWKTFLSLVIFYLLILLSFGNL